MPAFDPRILTMQMRMVMTMICASLQMMAWVDSPVTLLRKKWKINLNFQGQPWITVTISCNMGSQSVTVFLAKGVSLKSHCPALATANITCNWHHCATGIIMFEFDLLQVEESLTIVLNCLHVCCLQVIMDSGGSHWQILKIDWWIHDFQDWTVHCQDVRHVMIFWPKVYHSEKVEMQSIMWSDGQPRWEDLQDMSELAELAKALEEPAVKNLPIIEVDPLTPLLKALTLKGESPPDSLKVEVGSPKRSRSPRIQKRGRIDWSHPEVRKVVDDDTNVRCKLGFDKCVDGQWEVQMAWHWLLFFIWNEWTSLIILNLKLNRLHGVRNGKKWAQSMQWAISLPVIFCMMWLCDGLWCASARCSGAMKPGIACFFVACFSCSCRVWGSQVCLR